MAPRQFYVAVGTHEAKLVRLALAAGRPRAAQLCWRRGARPRLRVHAPPAAPLYTQSRRPPSLPPHRPAAAAPQTTLVELLQALQSEGAVPPPGAHVAIACGSRDALDEVVAALAACGTFALAVLVGGAAGACGGSALGGAAWG
jgi:hypothetical protein